MTAVAASGADLERVAAALERLLERDRPLYRRLWAYYRNPLRVCRVGGGGASASERPYRQGQEWGLPARITGVRSGVEPSEGGAVLEDVARKEVVIENDIGWRIDTMADYLFGRPIVIASAAPDPTRREVIGKLLRLILAQNGGIRFLQQLAQIGSVYGFVDVLVKACGGAMGSAAMNHSEGCGGTTALGEAPSAGRGWGERESSLGDGGSPGTRAGAGSVAGSVASGVGPEAGANADESNGRNAGAAGCGEDALLERVARMIRLEIVEPSRALPLLSGEDYRVVQAYGQVWERQKKGSGIGAQGSGSAGSWWGRLRGMFERAPLRFGGAGDQVQIVELITAGEWFRIEDGRVVARGRNSLGEVPLVHVQNSAAAFEYSGGSDVEPLIPLQDELNTRLSDRANRITLQSFKMYLAKGVDSFTEHPVSPGRMWMTDNERAEIVEFGGDASCPSEEAHISDLREALDKTSGVTPIAAGALKGRIGRLTSAAALRVTLLALLSKTDKKRTVYGAGIERMCELALKWLDAAGAFPNAREERRVELSWPSPLPENEMEKLEEAEVKVRLGVEPAVVLRELGY
jgi:hypothetical protein